MQQELAVTKSWFDEFVQHGSFISCLLSLFFGWGVSILVRFPVHRKVHDDAWATYLCYCICVAGSFLITAFTWPNEYRFAWAGTMAVISPLVGYVALWQVKKRWPDLYAFLSMRKVTPEPASDDEQLLDEKP